MRSRRGLILVGLTVSSSVGLATRFKIDGDRDEAMRRQLGLTEDDEDTNSVSIEAEDRKDIIYVHRDVENSERFGPRINEILRSERDVWDAILFLPSPTQRLRRILQKEKDLTHVHLDTRDDHTDDIIHVARKICRRHIHESRVDACRRAADTQNSKKTNPHQHKSSSLSNLKDRNDNSTELTQIRCVLRISSISQEFSYVWISFSDKIFLRDLQVSYPDKQVSESLNNIALELLRHNLVRLSPKPQSHWDDNDEQKPTSPSNRQI